MAQVPATPKARRAMTRLAAATLGPRWTLDHMDLQSSERQALERRADGAARPPHDPAVVFLIPLVGRHHVGNWADVEARLRATVDSLIGQTSDRWVAVICGQDAPDTIPFNDQIRFHRFTTPVPGNDKWAKLAQLCQTLPHLGVTSGYAMTFDADDLLNRRAVEEMVRRKASGGYLVTRGLVLDAQSRQIGQCAPQSLLAPGRKAFWKMCGSCAAWRFDLSVDTRDAEFLAAATAHEHRMFPYLAALAGRPMTPLNQDGAMYIVNHGENFGVRRGRVGFKTRYVTRFPVTSDAQRARIEADFPMA
ncbi:hypothetical protein CLV78_102186 [Aliiruegeria haliotis]|uniref:Glycosyl transferase family 2 n=1 Tax=Aliiruegeria haliotis TaxID=1280846 RepID=A0A2T0RUY5_9RHOB|nr:hypothetical protein [Aliiruegeria haliotis]PRY25009.1 hypothetical protein CLV78_102186 [Aliiruegeria haliotis]